MIGRHSTNFAKVVGVLGRSNTRRFLSSVFGIGDVHKPTELRHLLDVSCWSSRLDYLPHA